jgi:hypothetical protein
MRKVYLFAVAAALTLTAGVGVWTASTTYARVAGPTGVRIDPSELTMHMGNVPTQHFVDYSVVFE